MYNLFVILGLVYFLIVLGIAIFGAYFIAKWLAPYFGVDSSKAAVLALIADVLATIIQLLILS